MTTAAPGTSGRSPTPATGTLAPDSGRGLGASSALDPDQRRVTYLMLFRLVLISSVLGSTLLLSWAGDVDLSAPASLILFGIIGSTYLLTIVYAVLLRSTSDPLRLADYQLLADLATTAVLLHVTGGAQSAFSFFFPLSIIGAATIRFKKGAVQLALASAVVFATVSLLGWIQILPAPAGQRILPSEMSAIEFGRAMALNLAAIAGVGMLAVNLGGQLQRTSASLHTQRTVAADLFTLHADIVRSLASGLITIDPGDRVVSANEAACEILGTTAEQAVGLPVEAVFPGFAAIPGDHPPEELIRRADFALPRDAAPPLFLGLSVSPLRNNRDEFIGRVINFQDLTELREMERQIKRSERMATIGSLAAGIAHEIRNPLASISGSIELLGVAPGASEDDRALMGIVSREVQRLNTLISDLLDFANPQPRQLLTLDLGELCRETAQVFAQDAANADVEIEFVAGPGYEAEARVSADPNRLRQVAWNLLRNASEAVTRGERRAGKVTLRLESGPTEVRLSVTDTGEGIPPDNLERVFDPFFTTKVKGTGFGLATCHSIITEHGGSISVESTPGAGATFRVTLPRRRDARPPSQSTPAETS